MKTITGWFDQANYDMFATLKLPKNPVILESGTAAGKSVWALSELWPDADITTCDPNTAPQQLPGNVRFFNCKTVELDLQPFYKWTKKIDLLFIDNSHHLVDIKADWDKYEPFVKKGGYIVFHDYHPDGLGVEEIRDFVDALPKEKVKLFLEGEFHGAVYTK